MIAIEARGLCKQLGGKPILENLDLAIEEGGVFGLLGRNGAGKTTLISVLLGLYRPEHGHSRVANVDLAETPRARGRVGYVAEGDLLPGWAKIKDVLALEGALHQPWNDVACRAWLAREQVGVWRRIRSLSKGQRKRLEIEIVLAGRPSVFLLDEPFSGLDPVARQEVLEALLGYLAETRSTILISSHVLTDLERICDRIGVLAQGRIAANVPMDDLKEGGAIVRGGSAELPVAVHALATRREAELHTWVVTGLDGEQRNTLTNQGYEVIAGGLEDIGTELIRGLDRGLENGKEKLHV